MESYSFDNSAEVLQFCVRVASDLAVRARATRDAEPSLITFSESGNLYYKRYNLRI